MDGVLVARTRDVNFLSHVLKVPGGTFLHRIVGATNQSSRLVLSLFIAFN